MCENVIPQIVLAAHREATALDEAADSNFVVRHRDVPAEVIGGEETFLAAVAHVVADASVGFLVIKQQQLGDEALLAGLERAAILRLLVVLHVRPQALGARVLLAAYLTEIRRGVD